MSLKLKIAFMSGVDGANANAYARVVNELRNLNSKSMYSTRQILEVLQICSEQWEKEIDKYLG